MRYDGHIQVMQVEQTGNVDQYVKRNKKKRRTMEGNFGILVGRLGEELRPKLPVMIISYSR